MTGEHPFYTDEHGWVYARDLRPGDEVVLISGDTVRVASVERTSKRTTVYNFEVDGFHMYFVGERGAWMHNNPCAQLSVFHRTTAENIISIISRGGQS